MRHHLVYPRDEGGHFGVDAGRLLRPAGVTPRRDPVNHPASSGTLTHQRPSAVAAATVHASLLLEAAGTQHAAGESALEILLALAAREEGERRLLEGLGVRAACREVQKWASYILS